MIPGKYNIPNQYKGDSFERVNFAFFTTAATSGNEIDLTGATPKMQIRLDNSAGRLVKTLTIGDGLEWTDQSAGTFYVNPFAITFASGDYVYDLQITHSGGEIKTYLVGKVKVTDDVTT